MTASGDSISSLGLVKSENYSRHHLCFVITLQVACLRSINVSLAFHIYCIKWRGYRRRPINATKVRNDETGARTESIDINNFLYINLSANRFCSFQNKTRKIVRERVATALLTNFRNEIRRIMRSSIGLALAGLQMDKLERL